MPEPVKLKPATELTVAPKAAAVEPKVIDEFAKLAFDIAAEPDKFEFVKFVTAIVTVSPETVDVAPPEPTIFKVSPKPIVVAVELVSAIVIGLNEFVAENSYVNVVYLNF